MTKVQASAIITVVNFQLKMRCTETCRCSRKLCGWCYRLLYGCIFTVSNMFIEFHCERCRKLNGRNSYSLLKSSQLHALQTSFNSIKSLLWFISWQQSSTQMIIRTTKVHRIKLKYKCLQQISFYIF